MPNLEGSLQGYRFRRGVISGLAVDRKAETGDTETFGRFTSPDSTTSTMPLSEHILRKAARSPGAGGLLAGRGELRLAANAYGPGTCVMGLMVQMRQDPQVKALLGPNDVTAVAPIIVGRPRRRTPRCRREQPLVLPGDEMRLSVQGYADGGQVEPLPSRLTPMYCEWQSAAPAIRDMEVSDLTSPCPIPASWIQSSPQATCSIRCS